MTEGYGYIYCFSNPSMPGILKIGMTERTPETRLREANASDTWRPPTPYNIEFAKKVYNPSKKENTLHTLMEQYTDRIHPRREFFRISSEEVINFFDLTFFKFHFFINDIDFFFVIINQVFYIFLVFFNLLLHLLLLL